MTDPTVTVEASSSGLTFPRLLLRHAAELADAGAAMLVMEMVPSTVAERVTKALPIPTIGIAAGRECDGQVLVVSDLIGLSPDPPRFVRPKANVHAVIVHTGAAFVAEVQAADEEPAADGETS